MNTLKRSKTTLSWLSLASNVTCTPQRSTVTKKKNHIFSHVFLFSKQEHGRNGADNCIWLALSLPECQQTYETRQQ